jgi:hypothetical protein
MGRPKSNDPRTVVSARMTAKQRQILQRYAEIKGLSSESDALCRMVDGAEAFVAKHDGTVQAPVSAAVTSHQAPETSNSGLSDVDPSDEPLGDFGGRLNVGLPKTHTYDDDSEDSKFASDDSD